MAQIVTITNPLTGQPAQVDQLDHTAQQIDDAIARALPGGPIDITLQNKLGGIESTDYPGCYYRTVDGVTEWFNPPMILGVEYRTTERYLSKPVYVKLLDCGLLVKGTLTYPHGISDIDVCVRYSGVASTSTGVFSGKGALPSFTTPSALNSEWNIFVQNFGTTNIDIYSGGGLAGCPVYVTVWYTKTTD